MVELIVRVIKSNTKFGSFKNLLQLRTLLLSNSLDTLEKYSRFKRTIVLILSSSASSYISTLTSTSTLNPRVKNIAQFQHFYDLIKHH